MDIKVLDMQIFMDKFANADENEKRILANKLVDVLLNVAEAEKIQKEIQMDLNEQLENLGISTDDLLKAQKEDFNENERFCY